MGSDPDVGARSRCSPAAGHGGAPPRQVQVPRPSAAVRITELGLHQAAPREVRGAQEGGQAGQGRSEREGRSVQGPAWPEGAAGSAAVDAWRGRGVGWWRACGGGRTGAQVASRWEPTVTLFTPWGCAAFLCALVNNTIVY